MNIELQAAFHFHVFNGEIIAECPPAALLSPRFFRINFRRKTTRGTHFYDFSLEFMSSFGRRRVT